MRAVKTHWLRGNKGERTPPRIMVLDTESEVIETEPREVQGLRCWVLTAIERAEGDPRPQKQTWAWGTDHDGLLAAVQAPIKSGKAWRLFTHNLSYDLGLTRLPLRLIEAGWELGRHNLAADQPWAHLARKQKGLWLCDSWSWLPQPVEKLGEVVGVPKLGLPAADDSLEAWLARCRRDVEITAAALCRLMAEWDDRRLGWWSITGPASGWNILLHFPTRSRPDGHPPATEHPQTRLHHSGRERTLIVPDANARRFEREALYSGRRDVWKVGKLAGGPWSEIDLRTAHLAICARFPLPFRRWAPFQRLELDDWRLGNPAAGVVARVVVRASSPRYPLRLGGVVLHPVGRFQTVLAGPEIQDAIARGELEEIGPGYGYHVGGVMREWAEWALAVLADAGGDFDPLLSVAVKPWSRSVPGRWAMLHSREVKSGPSHVKGWALEPMTMGNPPRRGYRFHLKGEWHQSVNDEESDDSFPAVLAFIQSYCRLALNRLLDAFNPDDLASCNTEGFWVNDRGLQEVEAWEHNGPPATFKPSPGRTAAVAALSRYVAPLAVQLKATAHALEVKSPQHLKADDRRFYSGVPRAAVEIGPERFQFMTWPKLKGQIQNGDPRGYVRQLRTVSLAGLPVSRWVHESGYCEPVAVSYSPQTGNVINPPCREAIDRHGPLRALQHPALKRALKAAAVASDPGPA